MRIAVLCVLVGLIGCSRPTPVEVPVDADVRIAAPALEPAFQPPVAPMPREVAADKIHIDPILDGLHRGTIKLGDSVAEVAKIGADYQLTRNGMFTILERPDPFGGPRLISKNGKLVGAEYRSCCFLRIYFDEMTEEDKVACWKGYREAYLEQRGRIAPPPREVKKPAP